MMQFTAALLATTLLLAALPAAAHDRDNDWNYTSPPQVYAPPPSGTTYNFYGPTTNYFTTAPAYGAPADMSGAYYGPPQQSDPAYGGYYGASGYALPSAYYGAGYDPYYGAYGNGPPPQDYEAQRLDPWNSYNAGPDNGY